MLTTTTQWFYNAYHRPFHKQFQSHFPATHINHHNEPDATDLTENDAQLTFKAPCQVVIECGLAIVLLF